MSLRLDKLDYAIIELLQQDGRMPFQRIAEHVGVSAKTVSTRLDRLVDAGVIVITAVVCPAAIGYPVLATIFIESEMGQTMSVAEQLAAMEEVAFVSLTAGDPDIYASIRIKSNEMLAAFMTDKLAQIPGIRKARLLLLLKTLKMASQWQPPRPGT